MRIAFASGKGGTGKTTLSVNLCLYLAQGNRSVQFLDCDVEEPNSHIFLRPEIRERLPVKVMIPEINQDLCTHCGECSKHCQFHALVTLPTGVLSFPELCHGCRLCYRICPALAIAWGERVVGYVEKGTAFKDIEYVKGILNVGEPMAGPVIKEVKGYYQKNTLKIIDAPPGTSCSVVKAIIDADFVVLVTEPTPFGLHDLKIIASVVRKLKKPMGVFINRQTNDFIPLKKFLYEEGIPVLATMPEDMEIARVYSEGNLIIEELPQYRQNFLKLKENIEALLNNKFAV